MKIAERRYSTIVGKDDLSTPRFRLHTGKKYPSDISVLHYDVVRKDASGVPDVEVTNTYSIIDILNECIDDYHDRHKNG